MASAFYEALRKAVQAEGEDSNKYVELAKKAPTMEARDILLCIAKDEIMHRAKIDCLLLDEEA